MTDFKTRLTMFAYDEDGISTSTFPSIIYIHEENCAQRNTYLGSRNLGWSDIFAIFQSNFIEMKFWRMCVLVFGS